jgi:tetratricopeptide (TPR) repeat protein
VLADSLFSASRSSVSERRAGLAGRAAEMMELERAYAIARDKRQTRAVTILGATGIGKTRLVRDFVVRSRDGRSPRVLRGSAREGGPAYDLFARALRARFHIVEGMDPEAAKAQVRSQVADVLEDRKVGDVAYFLGQLLDLEFQDSPLIKALEGDAQQLRTMRRAVIKSFLEADAARASDPLVLVFDDLQWAHDDSLDLLAYLVDSLRAPIVLVCIARSEMITRREGWQRHGAQNHVLIELPPLSDAEAEALVRDLLAPCGEDPAVDELVDEAVVLAGGNPALLEQIVRIYHDTGVLEITDDFGDEHWSIHPGRLAQVKLPLSVRDAVQARISSLTPDERELLERGAAMGSVFWLGGLVAIQRQSRSAPSVWEGGESDDVVRLRQLLDDLVERDYVLRLPDSSFSGDEEFVFKHNLEREALVRITPPANARNYHRVLAEWLSFRESTDAREEYLEMLARHREKGGAPVAAAIAYVQAGEVARSRYANAKAAELYAKGLSLLAESEGEARASATANWAMSEDLRLKALHHSGEVLHLLGRNDQALKAFTAMLACAWRLDLRSKGGAAHARIGRLYRETARFDEASRHLTAALALFGQSHDERGIASTLDDIGKLHWLRGDYTLALEYTLRSLAMRRKLGDRRNIALSLNNLGLVQQDSGDYKGALDSFDQALRIRREIGDLVGVSATLNNLGTVAQESGDDRRALALFQEAYEIAKDTGDRHRLALFLTNVGETHNRLGDPYRAIQLLKQAEEMADDLGDKLGLAEAVRGLGKAYLARREYTKAREYTQRALELFSATGSKVQLGVALRSLGEVTAAACAGGVELQEAAEHLKKSMAIFEEVGNEVELARSCRAYATLLTRAPGYAGDPTAEAQARMLTARAEEIFAKVQASGGATLDPGNPKGQAAS